MLVEDEALLNGADVLVVLDVQDALEILVDRVVVPKTRSVSCLNTSTAIFNSEATYYCWALPNSELISPPLFASIC